MQVVWGQTSEAQLTELGRSLALRSRVVQDEASQLPKQQLALVVNGCHLKYSSDHLRNIFSEYHDGVESQRNEVRASIKKAYEEIHFVTVPHSLAPAYSKGVSVLRTTIVDNCGVVALGGHTLSGADICEMLTAGVAELQRSGLVPVPSIIRHVFFYHFLMPLVARLDEGYRSSLPRVEDMFTLDFSDTREVTLAQFDTEASRINHRELVGEAREDLQRRVDQAWKHFNELNTAIGEQELDVKREEEKRFSHSVNKVVAFKRSCVVMGKKQPVTETVNVFTEWHRTMTLRKNGTVHYSEWTSAEEKSDFDGADPEAAEGEFIKIPEPTDVADANGLDVPKSL